MNNIEKVQKIGELVVAREIAEIKLSAAIKDRHADAHQFWQTELLRVQERLSELLGCTVEELEE